MPAFDSAGTPVSNYSGTATSISTTHTASGSDRLSLIEVAMLSPNTLPSSVTYGGTAATLVLDQLDGDSIWRVGVYRLIAPATGSQTVQANFASAPTAIFLGCCTYTGVHQTTPLGTAVGGFVASGSLSLTPGSATDDLVADFIQAFDADGAPTIDAGAGQTRRYRHQHAGASELIASSTEPHSGGTTTTMSWSAPTGNTVGIAVAIKPAAAAASSLQRGALIILSAVNRAANF